MKRLRSLRLAIAALAAPLAFTATEAAAHAHLLKSDPAPNASVATPRKVSLEFSEKLEPKFSGADLTKAGGGAVAATSDVQGKILAVSPRTALAPGAYKVTWRVVSADGHKMKGDYSFTVK